MYSVSKSSFIIKKSSLLLIFLCIFIFGLISLVAIMSINSKAYSLEMVILSILFFFILTYIISSEKDKYTPLVFFSLLFYGYVFSGLYFSYYENIHTAKFFNFSGNFTTNDMKLSLFQAIVGYIFFVLGYKLSKNIKAKKINFEIKGINYQSSLVKIFLIVLFLISFGYWIYVSFRLAGGPLNLLSNMGISLLLLKNNYISTAPFLLAYMSTSLLYLIYLKNNKKIPFYVVLMIVASFIMYVSKGRLSGAVFYLLSFPLMYVIYYQYRVNIKIFSFFIGFIFLLGALYFYRFYSNLAYLGMDMENNILKLIGEHFFGMTNFGDLQSITFAGQYVKDKDYLFGSSFVDFLMMWIGKLTGIDIEHTSIGLRLREYFFSHVSTGAPAPGTISEMIMNFGYLGLTIVMFMFGVITRMIFKSIDFKLSVFNLYFYTHFLLFLMLLAKVDSTHINSLIFAVLPVLMLAFFMSFISRLKLKEINAN